MNASPHTHELVIRDSLLDDDALYVQYGDASGFVKGGPLFGWRLRRRVKKIIRQHDKGSIKAARRKAVMDKVKAEAPTSTWAVRDESVKPLSHHIGPPPLLADPITPGAILKATAELFGLTTPYDAGKIAGTSPSPMRRRRGSDDSSTAAVSRLGHRGAYTSVQISAVGAPSPAKLTCMNTRQVQQALYDLGWPIAVDGSFGEMTHRAVQAFQKGFGYYDLLIDGYAGPQTHQAIQLCLDRGGRVDDFFFWREFKSKGDGWINVHRELVRGLHEYRLRYGPTVIVSAYRDIAHNQSVGGAPNSQHVYGNAADIPRVASVNAVRNLRRFSGIGYEGGLVRHVDVRHVGPNTTGGTPDNPTLWHY